MDSPPVIPMRLSCFEVHPSGAYLASRPRRFRRSHAMISEARYLLVIWVTVAASALRHSGGISERMVPADLNGEDDEQGYY